MIYSKRRISIAILLALCFVALSSAFEPEPEMGGRGRMLKGGKGGKDGRMLSAYYPGPEKGGKGGKDVDRMLKGGKGGKDF